MFGHGKNKKIRHYLIVLLLFFSIFPSMSSAAEGWTRKADMPTARYGLSTNTVNGKIYAIGGRSGSQFFSVVEEYDPATDKWIRKADMPTKRVHLSTSVVNWKVYAIGGASGGPVSTVEEYDPATDKWTRKADMPTERFGLSTSVVNGKIYAIGGCPRGVPWGAPIVEEYDPATDIWTRKANVPTPKSRLSTSAVNGKIYAIGGISPPNGAALSTVEEYDPATDTWTKKADMPTARHGLSAGVVNGRIYAVGGQDDNDVILSVVEIYDPATDTWEEMPRMQVPRFNLSTCTLDQKIFAIGGQPGSWPTVTGAVEMYSAGTWEFAADPSPADGALHLDTWVTLSWTPGDFSVSHDVYFGESFEDVNTGNGNAFRGNQTTTFYAAGFPGFDYPDGLAQGTTYYWRVDEINDLHPDSPWIGDVWSFTIPSKKAYNPDPPDGAESVDVNVELSWTAGLDAILHTVYFGDSFDDVDNAIGSTQQAATTYKPGPLKPAKTYYWRVDESTGGRGSQTYKGDTWSFTTVGFVVDDFESYNDIDPPDPASNRIFDNWIDGFGTTDNGALVGNDFPPYAEQTVVHGGAQSMPYAYDNNMKKSEATLTLTALRDWTKDGVGVLSLWFRGYPASVGSFTEGPAGTYTMTGGGTDIYIPPDGFHFAYKTLSGAGSIVARVDSIENTHNWAKAGVMIRETLTPDSVYALACLTAAQGVNSQGRSSTGDFVTSHGGITAPHWVKLERDILDNFAVYHSPDGCTWQFVRNATPVNIHMKTDVYIGFAVVSCHPVYTCEAVFSNVTITGVVSSQWMNEDIGILSNDAEPLYVAIANDGGAPAVVYHDDPAAATTETWTQWNIDLSAFADQGVDLTKVDKIAIGLSTQGNATTPGGSGKMYFDDIRLNQPILK